MCRFLQRIRKRRADINWVSMFPELKEKEGRGSSACVFYYSRIHSPLVAAAAAASKSPPSPGAAVPSA